MINVFIAHAKGDSTQTVALALAHLKRYSSNEYTVTLGFDEWQRSFRKCGTWDAWAKYIATAKQYGSNHALFDVIVCIDPVVGKATESIVTAALAADKPVCLVDSNGLHTVLHVESLGEDYVASSRLVVAK